MRYLLIILMLAGFTVNMQAQKKEKYKTIEIQTSARCGDCKYNIEKSLAYEKGVKKSVLDVETSIVTVKYRPDKTTPEKIRKAISMAGYDADDVQADETAYNNLKGCCKKDAPKHHD